MTNNPEKGMVTSPSCSHFPMFNTNEQSEDLFLRAATILVPIIHRIFLLKI